MATTNTNTEPDALIAGDTAKWLKTLPDYPASSGWVLVYTLVNAASRVTFSATASADDHQVNVAPATTATWPPGAYQWRAAVTKAGEVYTVATGAISIAPAFGAAVDGRSHARKALANIEAYLEDPQNLTASSYEIAGRKLQRIPVADLLALRSRYQYEVAREDAASAAARGLPDKRRIYVRF